MQNNFKDVFKSVESYPMEADRVLANEEDIEEYHQKLRELLPQVRVGFLFNADETGEQDFVDSRSITVIVPKGYHKSRIPLPVSRCGKRLTVMHCISTDGTYMTPLFIHSRSTVDSEVYDVLHQNQFKIATQKNGFMDTEIFAHWFDEIFICELREKKGRITKACLS